MFAVTRYLAVTSAPHLKGTVGYTQPLGGAMQIAARFRERNADRGIRGGLADLFQTGAALQCFAHTRIE